MSATSTGPQCSRPGSSRWPGFRRKNVTVSLALDRRAHHRAAVAVDAARQIDRDDRDAGRVDRLDHRARRSLDRPVEARAEQRIDDQARARQAPPASAASTGPCQRARGLGRIALEPVAIAEQQQPNRIAALGQETRADKAVAAIVAGPGDDATIGAPRGLAGPPRRRPRVRRSPSAGCRASRRDGEPVGLGHFARW